MMSICFTGHRPDKLGEPNSSTYIKIEAFLREYIEKCINMFQYVNFISGGAQGVDLIAADIVLEMKKKYGDKVKLTMAIPYYNFGSKWPKDAKEHFDNILSKSDKIVYVHKGDHNGSNYLLHLRNYWMVDRSSLVIAVWDGSLGGTRNCYVYARDNNKKIIRYHFLNDEIRKIN